METPLLDVALIVKNEEQHLPLCLESIRSLGDLVSTVCIYDTGSTDGTIEIAEAAGARVERGYWDGDFARARNAAISLSSAKWVLILDADERVCANPKRLGPYLRRAVRQDFTGVDAISVAIVNQKDGKEGCESEAWLSTRLFRPSRAHYVGKVHEQVAARIAGKELISLDPGRAMIEIQHFGYSSAERVLAKTERNVAIAHEEIERLGSGGEDKELLIRAMVDRARSWIAQGNNEGALQDLRAVRSMDSSFNYRWWGMEQLADLLINLSVYDEAASVIDQLRREGSNVSYCDWLSARRLMAVGDISGGMAILRQLDVLSSVSGMVVKPKLLLESRMKGAIALGQFDEALACLLPLMSSGDAPGFGAVLLRLWGDRPPQVLAELLLASDKGHLHAVAEELAQLGGTGAAVVNELQARSATVAAG